MDDPLRVRASRASASWIAVSTIAGTAARACDEPCPQRLALEQLHHEERRALVLADVVQRADVGVVQAGDGPRFAREARAALSVGAQFCGEDLDGDRAVEAGVAGLVDLAHSARADAVDLVRTEAGRARHPCRLGRGLRRGRAACPQIEALWFLARIIRSPRAGQDEGAPAPRFSSLILAAGRPNGAIVSRNPKHVLGSGRAVGCHGRAQASQRAACGGQSW